MEVGVGLGVVAPEAGGLDVAVGVSVGVGAPGASVAVEVAVGVSVGVGAPGASVEVDVAVGPGAPGTEVEVGCHSPIEPAPQSTNASLNLLSL